MDIYQKKLGSLLDSGVENEVLEFKEAKTTYDFSKLGQYFSALCNEANLKKQSSAYLVFGVNDDRKVVGSNFRPLRENLDSLKKEIADKTTNRVTFKEIIEINDPSGRVILFEIPAAPKGLPVAFAGHYYGRDGESLVALNIEKIERIRNQNVNEDWSAQIVPDADILDLDEEAMHLARNNYKVKFQNQVNEVDSWDDATFLNKAKLTIKGKITSTTLLLLGKNEAEHFLKVDPKIRWILKDHQNIEKDYVVFGLPLIVAVNKIYAKIRNTKYRYLQPGTLFPEEVDKYDSFSIREALHNCIAHQDYTKAGRINVIEHDDSLQFTNRGSFIPGNVLQVVVDDAPEEHYRNRFLATAMFNLNMVDTIGGGIKKMFIAQSKRYFPLPEYDLSNDRVSVILTGKVLDQDYANLLAKNHDLRLSEIIAIDKVQKKLRLTDEEIKNLKNKKLIEGRKPNFYIARAIAQGTGEKASYTRNKGFDDDFYCELMLKALLDHGSMSRKDFNILLLDKLPEVMTDRQKKNKIGNLLSKLKRKQKILNNGSDVRPCWMLT